MNIEARIFDHGSSARLLASAPEPVFIFDGRLPVLVWANDAALAFTGQAPDLAAKTGRKDRAQSPQLPHFDRAMPAMVTLRALAAQDMPAAGLRTELVFWTAHGAQTLRCDCRKASFAFAQEALIVHAVPAKSVAGPVATAASSPPEASDPAIAVAPSQTASAAVPATRSHRAPQAIRPVRAVRSQASSAQKSTPVRSVVQAPPARGPAGRKSAVEGASEPAAFSTPDILAPARFAEALPAERAPDTRERLPPAPPVPTASRASALPTAIAINRATPPNDAAALREIARQIQSATAAHVSTFTAKVSFPTTDTHAPDFLSQIGHEIRTPLNSILGFAEIMRDERLGPVGNARYKGYAADIHESATHALSLIDDLLDLSRIEAGGAHLEPTGVDVATVITQAARAVQPAADKAGVSLAVPAGRPLPLIVCDPRSLKQMLLNLLSNAVRNTDSGGAVWVTAAVDEGTGLILRVQDTGVGMTVEDIAIALQPWRQVGAAERRAGGTGLGLPLTKAMAEANGATLRLERIAGGGLAALLVFPTEKIVRV